MTDKILFKKNEDVKSSDVILIKNDLVSVIFSEDGMSYNDIIKLLKEIRKSDLSCIRNNKAFDILKGTENDILLKKITLIDLNNTGECPSLSIFKDLNLGMIQKNLRDYKLVKMLN